MNITTTTEGGKNFASKDGDNFEHLPARSRTPVYIPHGMELALPSPANHKRTGNFGSPSNEFWNPSHDRYCLTSGTEVNITNNTTVLVVDVPVKPIEKLKRAVKKMQRLSRKETSLPRKPDVSLSRSSSVRPSDVGRHISRYDTGRSSLRLDRDRDRDRDRTRRGLNSETSSIADKSEMDAVQLLRENTDLRHRLEDEEASYRRKIDTYRLAQQHQATLVSRLQSKVLQYKKRCSDLENQIKDNIPLFDSIKQYKAITAPPGSALDAAQQHLRDSQDEPIIDFDSALRRLGDEQARNEKLTKLNLALREQLEESQQTNESLTNDLQKLACDWQKMRDEMVEKEEEWKEEEQFFNEYYNTEHNRMLNLWKDIISMKRSFAEIQSATQRDLSKLRNEVNSTSNDMVATCSNLLTNTAQNMMAGKQQEMKKENYELQSRINKLKIDYDNAIEQVKQKDDKIQQLSKEIQLLNKKVTETDESIQEISQLQDEVKLLLNGLSEIAQTVVHDADLKDIDIIQSMPHIHLSSMMATPSRSQSENVLRVHSANAFVENTISGVQAALYKYQSQIHELQVKISSLSEQLLSTDKQNENHADMQRKLMDKISEQNDELDSLKAELNLLNQEKESLVKALDSSRAEKFAVEKNRAEISDMLESVNNDYEKILKGNNRLQKIALNLEDEKNFLQNEADRLTKELETREIAHHMTEDRCSQMLEELFTIKEELNRERLDKELIEQNRAEAQSLLNYVEKTKGELEAELQRVLMERSEVHDALSKAESLVSSLEEEKKKLTEELKNTDESKTKFQNQLADLNNDLEAVRKELLHTEQNRLDLETEKMSLLEKYKYVEAEREKVELELGGVTHERNELSDQLINSQRKKDALNDELMRLRHRIEQVSETNARVNKHLEDLVKECEEKQVMLESNEKEIIHLQELNAVLKNDKESLEAALFETQNNLEASEIKRENMEKDIQELLGKQDFLKNEICRLENELETVSKQFNDTKNSLMQQLKSLENEYKQKIDSLKNQNEENTKRLEEEKEQAKANAEKRMQSSIAELERNKTEELLHLEKKMDNLKQHVDMQNQQYEEALRRAENDKQQALLLAHQDQKALLEKMESVRNELEEERAALEKLRREANLKAEQDRSNINTLREQVTRLTSKMDDMRIKTEEEKQRLENEMEGVKKDRDGYMKQCEELKVELSLSEDRYENIKIQLAETNHKLKEIEKSADNSRRELNDIKRQLNECGIEKEKYLLSNKELRDFIKKSEAEKREQARSLEESHQKIAGLEDKISQFENEKSKLQNVCRDIEFKLLQSNQGAQNLQQELEKSNAANQQKQNDEKELLVKLNLELEDKDKLQQELHIYKKQLIDAERNIEANQQELMKIRQRIRDDEEGWRMREQELLARLEDGRVKERKLEDQRHNLELCLTDANQQMQELKSRLGGSEGRVRALDTQLTQLEVTKKDLENRLKAIGNIFKRLNVIQADGPLSSPLRALAPARRWSPSRAVAQDAVFENGRTDSAFDVNPESIKKNVRFLLQQMAQLERDRDDLKIQNVNMKKQLDETYDLQNKNESKISNMVQCIRQLNEEKGSLEMHLDQKEASLMNETELLKHKIDENQQLRDKIASLEINLQSGTEEKFHCEERVMKLRNLNSQLENERQKLKEDLTRCESRSARLEIQRIALEGDLNRLQMILQEKDIHIQKMQDRLEAQTRTIANLEEKCDSLQSSVDQMNSSLEIAGSVEADLRSEIQSLQKSLSDCAFSSSSTNDRIKQLQKTLSNNENERRLLSERLERAERALTEMHAECKARAEQICALQSELDGKDIQKAHLEDQLRFAKYSSSALDDKDNYTTHKLQIECCELRGKIEMLEEKLRRVESEKKNLEKKLSKERGKSHDKMDTSDLMASNYAFGATSSLNLSYLEHENKDLKQRCNQLEAQLAEKESELARLRAKEFSRSSIDRGEDMERFRAGQLRAEHLLKAREQSHRQQVQHLKNEISNLRKRLDQEMKLKRRYLLESPAENLRIRQLRETLADSLRTVSQNPTLDALLLDHETKKLNSSLHLVKQDRLKSLLPTPR